MGGARGKGMVVHCVQTNELPEAQAVGSGEGRMVGHKEALAGLVTRTMGQEWVVLWI